MQHVIRKSPDVTPSAILVDGNGVFHPRHAGLACFVGVHNGIPTIGIGKSLLFIPSTRTIQLTTMMAAIMAVTIFVGTEKS